MKRRQLTISAAPAAPAASSTVRDVLELAELCVAELRKSSMETDAPGQLVKLTDLARMVALMDEVRARHVRRADAPADAPGGPFAKLHGVLTPAEWKRLKALPMRTKKAAVPATAPEQGGVANDLAFVVENEVSKLLAQARENAWGLAKPAELIALLELTLRLPSAPEEKQELDLSALAIDDLRFIRDAMGWMQGKPRPEIPPGGEAALALARSGYTLAEIHDETGWDGGRIANLCAAHHVRLARPWRRVGS